jgi:RNA polymerase sigma-70 factor (ECF subfamily)
VYAPKKIAIISFGQRYINYEGDDMTAFQQELSALFEENRPLVYRTAYNVTGSTGDAEDVLQNVFVKLMKGQPSSDLQKNPQGYLYRAATNEALSILRSRERRKRLEEDLRSMPAPAPVSESDRDDQIARLRAATAKMKPGYVETLTLHYSEGRTCADIAKIRGKPLGTVLADLYRGRAEMRRLVRMEEKHGETQKRKHERDRSQVLASAPDAGNGSGVGPGPAAPAERV